MRFDPASLLRALAEGIFRGKQRPADEKIQLKNAKLYRKALKKVLKDKVITEKEKRYLAELEALLE